MEWCLESLAVRYGVGSPEHVLHVMLDRVRAASKAAGKVPTERAGGPLESACDITGVLLNLQIREYADAQKAMMEMQLDVIVEGFRTAAVSDEESRKLAGSLEHAKPNMLVSPCHPDMYNNTNGVEWVIRHDHVKPSNTQRLLPDWRAAKTTGALRSIYATCRPNGWVP